jgi:hypothetical protein
MDMESNMSDAGAALAAKIDSAPAAHPASALRQCGPCTACCTVMGVVELNKGNYQPCSFNCGSCAIYESRPTMCREWSCVWLLGFIKGDEPTRPDQLGLIFNRETLGGRHLLVAYEVWPRAGRDPDSVALLLTMSLMAPVILREYQTRRCEVITPDADLSQTLRESILSEWCQKPNAQWSDCAYPA